MSMKQLMASLASKDGITETLIPGIRLFRASSPSPRQPLCYDQGVLIVAQGAKIVHIGGKSYRYNADNYLVLTVPVPAECETIATPEEPVLLMMADLDLQVISSVISRMGEQYSLPVPAAQASHGSLRLSPMNEELEKTVIRILEALKSPLESAALGPSLLSELVFRLLLGGNGDALHELITSNSNLARVHRTLKVIHSDYSSSFNIDQLAAMANMSTTSYHRAFKEVTSSTPIQYLKKIRLYKAKTLLENDGTRVNEAAVEVGYESTAQFSREFKRYFGHSPVHCRPSGQR